MKTLNQIIKINPTLNRELIQPLIEQEICFFTFKKKYTNGLTIWLSTHVEWVRYYIENEFYKVCAFEKNPGFYSEGCILWTELRHQPIYSSLERDFDISNGVTLIKPQTCSCEFYSFGTSKGNDSTIRFYLKNINFLEDFSISFREKISNEIKIFEIKNTKPSNIHFKKSKKTIDEDLLINIKKYYINSDGKDICLTKREAEVLNFLRSGKTEEEIGMILKLSRRTCEGYVKNIKIKFNCKSLFLLGVKFGILDNYNIIY